MYRSAPDILKTTDTFYATLGLKTNERLTFDAGTTNTDGLIWGTDTNLYRSFADTLKTDDDFYCNSIYVTDGGIVDSTSTYAGLIQVNPTRPYLKIQEYTDASNNSFATLNPDAQTAFQWIYVEGGVAMANIFMSRAASGAKTAYINIDGELVGRVRDRGTTEPTTDLREGDTFYRTATDIGWFIYDTGAGWVKIS